MTWVPAGTQPHQAAQACYDLVANGHSDWYLPAEAELYVLYNNKTAIGNFDLSGTVFSGYYWTSTEWITPNNRAEAVVLMDGFLDAPFKNSAADVRCVRK